MKDAHLQGSVNMLIFQPTTLPNGSRGRAISNGGLASVRIRPGQAHNLYDGRSVSAHVSVRHAQFVAVWQDFLLSFC